MLIFSRSIVVNKINLAYYADMPEKMPPKWYSRFEHFLFRNKGVIFIILWILIFFVWPLMQAPEPLDAQLFVGVED